MRKLEEYQAHIKDTHADRRNLKMRASVQTAIDETLCACGHTDGYHSLSGICRCCNCHAFKACEKAQ